MSCVRWCWAGASGTYYTITPQIPQISQSIWCKLILSPAPTDRILYTEAQQQLNYEKDIHSYFFISVYFVRWQVHRSSMEHRKTSLSGTASPSQSFRLFYRFPASEHRLELWNIKCPLVSMSTMAAMCDHYDQCCHHESWSTHCFIRSTGGNSW